jgi:hypothetical protein
MARVVGVHGVGKQLLGPETIGSAWRPALADGLRQAAAGSLPDNDFAMAFYGDVFRPAGHALAVGGPLYTAADVDQGFELEMLLAWWEAAAAVDPAVAPTGGDTPARFPRTAQAAARALCRAAFFSRITLHSLVFDLKQMRRYLLDAEVRTAACERVKAAIGPETRVVVAHSLGSVVAYEALCALPHHQVRALVTLGSPLGMRMVFERLRPAPAPQGAWPGGERLRWTNVADEDDVIAAVKNLRPRFGDEVTEIVVHNGSHAHDATAYLTARLTGVAVAAGLGD